MGPGALVLAPKVIAGGVPLVAKILAGLGLTARSWHYCK